MDWRKHERLPSHQCDPWSVWVQQWCQTFPGFPPTRRENASHRLGLPPVPSIISWTAFTFRLFIHHTSTANMIGDQSEVAVWGDKWENSITLPFLVPGKNLFHHFQGATVSTYRTQGWKETSSKSLGLTKLMVRSGMPVSFTEQSMYPWISVDTVLPDLSIIASTLAKNVRINQLT